MAALTKGLFPLTKQSGKIGAMGFVAGSTSLAYRRMHMLAGKNLFRVAQKAGFVAGRLEQPRPRCIVGQVTAVAGPLLHRMMEIFQLFQ